MKKVYIFLAQGFEEIEALAPADLLRRAGAEVLLVSMNGQKLVTGAKGIRVEADIEISRVTEPYDMLVLPGGYPGYESLAKSEELYKILSSAFEKGAYVGAICGAPAAVLGSKGFLAGSCATCYPGMEDMLNCAQVSDCGVCVDCRLITAKSAGYAIDFSLTLVKCLFGESEKNKVKDSIVYHG